MPSINGKTHVCTNPVKQNNGLGVGQKSIKISKKSSSNVALGPLEFGECCFSTEDDNVPLNGELFTTRDEHNKAFPKWSPDEGPDHRTPALATNSSSMEGTEFSHKCASSLETGFTHDLEHVDLDTMPNTDGNIAVNNSNCNDQTEADFRTSSYYQACDVSDLFCSDSIFAGLCPGDLVNNINTVINTSSDLDYDYAMSSLLLDDDRVMLPFLMDTSQMTYPDAMGSCEPLVTDSDNGSLSLASNQINSQESDICSTLIKPKNLIHSS